MKLSGNTKAILLLAAGLAAIAILSTIILLNREERGFMVRECQAGEGVEKPLRWKASSLPVPVYLEESDAELLEDVKAGVDF